MPYASRQQARWAHATDQPFAARWDKLTDFARLPKRARRLAKRRKDSAATGLVIPPTGPHALFNQPGVERRRPKRLKRRQKELDPIAAIERYVSMPDFDQALVDLAVAAIPQIERLKGESIAPGVTRIRGNLCNVHGKYGPCDAALSGKKKPGTSKKPKAPAKAKLTPEQRQQVRDQEQAKNRAQTLAQMGIPPEGQAALDALRSGAQPDADAVARGGFEAAGIVERGLDGSYRLTASGRALMGAADSGDVGRAGATIGSARDRVTARQERLAKRQAKQPKAGGGKGKQQAKPTTTTPAAPAAASRAEERAEIAFQQRQQDRQERIRRQQAADAKRAQQEVERTRRQTTAQRRQQARDEQRANAALRKIHHVSRRPDPSTAKSADTFMVFKDASGADRWLSITTTAYRDRDEEIISTKAITRAVAIGDASGQRGPLRYWHVPGLDLGDCDYQAQGGPGGRFLIESGTFRSNAFADLGRALASQDYQMSPGFVHPRTQPQGGVFDDIAIFERSAVPAHRASNYFTRFMTKEDRMLTAEKVAEYKSRAGDNAEALALLESLLEKTETTDKSAQDAGVVYKDAPAWAQALITRLDGLETTVKAMAPASMEQAGETEIANAEAEQAAHSADELDGDENMLTPGEIQAIAAAVVQAITPLLDIEKKMAGHMADLKGALGGYTAQKDASAAETADRLGKVEKAVADIAQGEFPRSVFAQVAGSGAIFRPSEAPQTEIPAQLAERAKEALAGVPAGLSGPEADAYKLIWG